MSYIFVPCLAFRVRVAGDMNNKNNVRSRFSPDSGRSPFTRAHPLESELFTAIKHFLI